MAKRPYYVEKDDPRITPERNCYWWEGYDARMGGEPFAILTTTSDWRHGWATADDSMFGKKTKDL